MDSMKLIFLIYQAPFLSYQFLLLIQFYIVLGPIKMVRRLMDFRNFRMLLGDLLLLAIILVLYKLHLF